MSKKTYNSFVLEPVETSSMEGKAVGRTWKIIREARLAGKPDPDFTRLPCERCGQPLDQHQGLVATSSGAITKAVCRDGEKAVIAKDYFMLTVPQLDRPCPTVTNPDQMSGMEAATALWYAPFKTGLIRLRAEWQHRRRTKLRDCYRLGDQGMKAP